MPPTNRSPRNYLTLLTHVSLWVVFLGVPLLFAPPQPVPPSEWPGAPPLETRMWVTFSLNLCLIGFFYLNYGWLLPRFYLRRETLRYFLSIVVVYGVFQMAVALVRNLAFSQMHLPSQTETFARATQVFSTGFFVLIWAASSGFRLGEEWQRAENRRRETERARLSAELSQLKSQLNPHFLFNTLNGIYTLALSKSDDAPDVVLKLSYLLRYVMAETNADFVPLERDLEHLSHFIELHQMRLTAQTPVTFSVEGDLAGHRIAPLLLLPFVENAFKFGSSARELSPIDISLKINGKRLEFTCNNLLRSTADDSTGIGLVNTRRRLDLLYQGQHTLETGPQNGAFVVNLQLDLLP